jgi:hypothetical protein
MPGFHQQGNEPLVSTAAEHVFNNYHRFKEDKAPHRHLLPPS